MPRTKVLDSDGGVAAVRSFEQCIRGGHGSAAARLARAYGWKKVRPGDNHPRTSRPGPSRRGRLVALRTESGLTVVLVTHDADVAARADRTVRMLDGRALTPAPSERRAVPVDSAG